MATTSGFFNSINGDRRYLAQNFASYFASFIGNGVFPNPSNGLQVYAAEKMNVTVKAGRAWINGYDFINDSDYILTIERADGVLNRIDRIVVRLDLAEREITLAIKKGKLASSPVAPTLQRDTVIHELGIADIYVSKGVTAISQTYITDLRLNSKYCGIVAGVVEQIDTSSVFNQYQDWFNTYSVVKAQEFADWQQATKDAVDNWINSEQLGFENWRTDQENIFADWFATAKTVFENWSAEEKTFFESWFKDVKDELSTNQAGNLYNMITAPLPLRFIRDGVIYRYGFTVTDDFEGLIFNCEEDV